MIMQERVFGLKGSIGELKAKLLLLKNRLPFMTEIQIEEATESVVRMEHDLTKYNYELGQIYLELNDVSYFCTMDEKKM